MIRMLMLMSLITLALGCVKLEPRRPVNKQKQIFLKESAKRNKNKLAIEQELFKQVITNDKKLEYSATPQGFWYAYKQRGKNQYLKPVEGDRVTFSYRIEDLNQNLLYDEEQLGIVSFHVDQEDLIPALREGVKYLTPGDIAVFLFPSYLCFGYQGDGEKIGVNQPLRFTIELLKLKKLN